MHLSYFLKFSKVIYQAKNKINHSANSEYKNIIDIADHCDDDGHYIINTAEEDLLFMIKSVIYTYRNNKLATPRQNMQYYKCINTYHDTDDIYYPLHRYKLNKDQMKYLLDKLYNESIQKITIELIVSLALEKCWRTVWVIDPRRYGCIIYEVDSMLAAYLRLNGIWEYTYSTKRFSTEDLSGMWQCTQSLRTIALYTTLKNNIDPIIKICKEDLIGVLLIDLINELNCQTYDYALGNYLFTKDHLKYLSDELGNIFIEYKFLFC